MGYRGNIIPVGSGRYLYSPVFTANVEDVDCACLSLFPYQVEKQSRSNDIIFVSLDINGRNVTNFSYAAVENFGLTQQNHSGCSSQES